MALTEDQSQNPETASRKNTDKTKRHRTLAQKWRLVSLANKLIVIATMVIAGFTVVLACVSYHQWCEMQKSNKTTQQLANLAMETESANVWAYNACLTEKVLSAGEKDPVCTIQMLIPTKSDLPYYAAVEFENYGPSVAIITKERVEWPVLDRGHSLPDIPTYNPPIQTKGGDFAIRPSGMPIHIERIFADDSKSFSQNEIDAIKKNKRVLWIYGFIDMEIFPNRCQRIRFCYDSAGAVGVACPSAYRARTEPAEIQKDGQCPN